MGVLQVLSQEVCQTFLAYQTQNKDILSLQSLYAWSFYYLMMSLIHHQLSCLPQYAIVNSMSRAPVTNSYNDWACLVTRHKVYPNLSLGHTSQ